jgi:rare lipoprotein A
MHMRTTAALVVALVLSAPLSLSASMAHDLTGKASWYSLPGNKMANGQIFNPSRISVAHKTLPLGTNVCITNLDNGITVRNIPVTDRGPYIKGRVFDASKALARKLGFIPAGTAHVKGWVC